MLVKDAIGQFLRDAEIGMSSGSVTTYRSALRAFQSTLSDDFTVEALTSDQIVDYIRILGREGKLAQSTLFLYASAVTAFLTYLVREQVVEFPLQMLRPRLKALLGRLPKRLPRVPDDIVVEALLTAARQRPEGTEPSWQLQRLRDIAILECLRSSGARISELCNLTRGDLLSQDHGARVVGKGDKMRVVFFSPVAWDALQQYLSARPDSSSGRRIGAIPLFARHDRAARRRLFPLSPQGVRKSLEQLAHDAHVVEAGVTPHRLRAWFATTMLAETGNLAAVQDLLGHESANTTRIYTKVRPQELRRVHAQVFTANQAQDAAGEATPRDLEIPRSSNHP